MLCPGLAVEVGRDGYAVSLICKQAPRSLRHACSCQCNHAGRMAGHLPYGILGEDAPWSDLSQ